MIILFSIFYFLLALRRPKLALFLLLALLPTYQLRFQVFGLPTTLLEVMVLILFIAWFFKFQIYRLSSIQNLISKIQSWLWPLLAWLVVGLIAVVVSPDKWGALGLWRAYFLEPILFLIVFVDIIKREGDRYLIYSALALVGFVSAAWAINQNWLGGGVLSTEVWGASKVWRATGPFPQPNFLGLFLAPLIILFFGQFVEYFKTKKLLSLAWLTIAALAVWAIVLARSDGAMLGLAAALIFMGLVCRVSRKWVIVGLAVLILIAVVAPVFRNYLLPKIIFQELSGQLRLNIWGGDIALIKDHPILGVGLRGYQKLIPKYQKPYYDPQTHQLISVETHPYPHNLFLAIWSELGILGLLVFLWIIVKFFYQGFNKPKAVIGYSLFVISLMASMLAIIVHGLVDTPYFKNDLAILFWLIIGLMIISSREQIYENS